MLFCYLWFNYEYWRNVSISRSINRSIYRQIGWTAFKSKTIKNVIGSFADWVNSLFVIIKWRLSFVGLMTKWLTRSGNKCCNRQLTPNSPAKYYNPRNPLYIQEIHRLNIEIHEDSESPAALQISHFGGDGKKFSAPTRRLRLPEPWTKSPPMTTCTICVEQHVDYDICACIWQTMCISH